MGDGMPYTRYPSPIAPDILTYILYPTMIILQNKRLHTALVALIELVQDYVYRKETLEQIAGLDVLDLTDGYQLLAGLGRVLEHGCGADYRVEFSRALAQQGATVSARAYFAHQQAMAELLLDQ